MHNEMCFLSMQSYNIPSVIAYQKMCLISDNKLIMIAMWCLNLLETLQLENEMRLR